MEVGSIDAERLVFVDEMGTHTSLAPLYAYSPIGERAFFEVPRNRGKNTTLLTSMTTGGMGPSLAVEGATTSKVFETYVERLLAPALRSGQVVVMDNTSGRTDQRGLGSSSRRGDASSSTCRPTPRTSIRSKKPSRRSSTSSGRSRPAPRSYSSKRWVAHWQP
jgi:hypothetical protein